MVAPFTGPFASTHLFRCATPYKWYQSGRAVMLSWISKLCCHMFNSDLEIWIWMFSYYSICKTNPVLQTPNKLVIPL